MLPAFKGSFLLKLIALGTAVLVLFSLESGKQLLFAETSRIPVASAYFATPQASLEALQVAARATTALRAPPAPASSAPALLPAGLPAQAPALLSAGLPVQASAQGNLGPPSVVTSEAVDDWLADRWQAARNMQGEPLPGEHWLELDLRGAAALSHFLVDFEKAHATDYAIQARAASGEEWRTVAEGRAARETERSDMHIVHELPALQGASGRHVRLLIHAPATQWGTSVWRFHVYGVKQR